MDWGRATLGCFAGWMLLMAPIAANARQLVQRSQHTEPNSIEESENTTQRAFQLQLSTTAIQLLDTNESEVWLDLFLGSGQGLAGRQPTLVTTTQHFMPLYLHSVQNLDRRRLSLSVNGISSIRDTESLLEDFSDAHQCQVKLHFPEQMLLPGLLAQNKLDIHRTRLPGSNLCQPMRGVEKLQLSTRLRVFPVSIGEVASLDVGTMDYKLRRDVDGEVITSLQVAPKLAFTPVDDIQLELSYDLKLESPQLLPEDWGAATRTHRGTAQLNLGLPQFLGNKIEWQFKGEYDWLTAELKPIDVEMTWHLLPLDIRWLASTEYSLAAKNNHPILFELHHELPWGIGWGVSTDYHISNGQLGPLKLSLDNNISLLQWLFSPQSLGKQIGIRYGLEARQRERDESMEYALEAGIVAGDRERGLWGFDVDLDDSSIQSFDASYSRHDWQFQMRIVPNLDAHQVEGRITFMPENRLPGRLPLSHRMELGAL